jgi:ABC-type glutathione transport system ATPase component
LSYSKSHIWRNFGILWAWWALYVAVTAYFTTFKISAGAGNSYLTFVRNRHNTIRTDKKPGDPESAAVSSSDSVAAMVPDGDGAAPGSPGLIRNTSIFTWRDIRYTVKVPGGERLLLDSISGFVKPGQLGALMGSSGAGKTTLLFLAWNG